jgi:pimeloyl-ACP methyl ester carboxylesterase
MMRMMPDGARIAYRRQGDGPGTVLVHGGFIDSSSWTGLMEVLARTRTVVAADRRGHGDSDPYTSSYRLSDDAGDLVAIVTELAAEAGQVELVAVSAGCHVALAAAVAGAPATRVVLWEPPDFQATPVSAELYDRLDRAAASGDRKLLVRLLLNECPMSSGGCGGALGRRRCRPASSAR